MAKKKLPSGIEITELMLVKADWQRTFVAEICREITSEGVSIVRGSVVVNEGKIWSVAESQEELGKCLDDLCVMKLEMGLHANHGITSKIFNYDIFLN